MKGCKSIFFLLRRYVIFFAMAAFIVTCCMVLFLKGMEIPDDVIRRNAPLTFANVLFLSLIFSLIDLVFYRFTTARTLKKIHNAAMRLSKGDFSARIEQDACRSGFNVIIDDFNRMAQELSGIETLRSDFISNVSHEIKTPLAVISNYVTLLQDKSLSEDERMEYALFIASSARKLSRLVTNILRLNKLENQTVFPVSEKYDLSEQICECLLDFESVWEKKKIALGTDISENVFIGADSEMLKIVWNNLFSNAFKFTPEGGRVSVSLKTDGDFVFVTVEDTGCGIAPDTGSRIFEKFYQGDSSHASEGNGLGLALVRRVIDIVGGEIHVSSELNKGSRFTVILRREP